MTSSIDYSLPNQNAFLTPETILQSRYRILRPLGQGGMGAVYEAVDLRLGHTVALKQTLTADAELWNHFEQEARLLAQLNHPVLPRVTDYFTESNRAFFVMQFVAGADLADVLARQSGPIPCSSVVAWADQLLDALIYLHSHERQIIHRDIKPHNLKVTPNGRIVLLDFGLAKSGSANSQTESCASVYGYTPRYAPLEQIQDQGTSPRSDIYALGATLYHLLTGIKPPDAVTRAAALISSRPNPLRPAHEVNCAVHPELAAILNKAMAQNPAKRYETAAEFREALRRLGRVSDFDFNFAFTTPADEQGENETGETTVVRPHLTTRRQRPAASRAVAALFAVLFVGFGVFCCFYQWKLPVNFAQRSPYSQDRK